MTMTTLHLCCCALAVGFHAGLVFAERVAIPGAMPAFAARLPRHPRPARDIRLRYNRGDEDSESLLLTDATIADADPVARPAEAAAAEAEALLAEIEARGEGWASAAAALDAATPRVADLARDLVLSEADWIEERDREAAEAVPREDIARRKEVAGILRGIRRLRTEEQVARRAEARRRREAGGAAAGRAAAARRSVLVAQLADVLMEAEALLEEQAMEEAEALLEEVERQRRE